MKHHETYANEQPLNNATAGHTPGDWYCARMGNDHQGLVISETTGANVAVTYDKRDAPIVAAAPEMLEALRGLQLVAEYTDRHEGQTMRELFPHRFAALDAAVARATGGQPI